MKPLVHLLHITDKTRQLETRSIKLVSRKMLFVLIFRYILLKGKKWFANHLSLVSMGSILPEMLICMFCGLIVCMEETIVPHLSYSLVLG